MSSEGHFTASIKYFFDTYALIEIFEGNKAYSKYVGEPFFITLLNFFELHQYLLRIGNEAFADEKVELYVSHIREVAPAIAIKASKFRRQHKEKDLSMSDCMGYLYAKENSLIFLTGDKEFAGLPNVEFVRK